MIMCGNCASFLCVQFGGGKKKDAVDDSESKEVCIAYCCCSVHSCIHIVFSTISLITYTLAMHGKM